MVEVAIRVMCRNAFISITRFHLESFEIIRDPAEQAVATMRHYAEQAVATMRHYAEQAVVTIRHNAELALLSIYFTIPNSGDNYASLYGTRRFDYTSLYGISITGHIQEYSSNMCACEVLCRSRS